MKKLIILLIVLLSLSFLNPQVRLAFSIGTGFGIPTLQAKIQKIQTNAIRGNVTKSDKQFLQKFYQTLAYGASMTVLLSESARLMHHYLDGSGKQTSIKVSLFTESPRVAKRMNAIRRKLRKICVDGTREISDRFEMGHGRPLDAHFALYYGTIEGNVLREEGSKFIRWTALMPWKWPTYDFFKQKYGTYYKEIFPIPNALALVKLGPPLRLPNALGGELEKQGLAKSFQTKTVWKERLRCT